jgi:hypothetical protein
MRRTIERGSRLLPLPLAATCLLAAASPQTPSLAPSNPAPVTVFGQPVVVQPGTKSGPLSAMGCEEDETSGCIICTTSCAVDSNWMGAGIAAVVPFGGTRFAKSSLFTDFEVGATPQTEENLVPVSIEYDVEWLGEWALVQVIGGGIGTASAEVTLYLEELPSGAILKTEKLDKEEPDDQISIDVVGGGVWVDSDGIQDSFTALLRRGRQYRIRLTLEIRVVFVVSASYYVLAYGPAPLQGAGWNTLSVTVGEDPPKAGVAAKAVDDFIALTGGNVTDCLATHTITTPQGGWVHVTATCQANAFHQNGTVTQANFGVTDDMEILPTNQDLAFSVSSGYPSGTLVAPVTAQAVFPVSGAGDHTFYFMGKSTSGGMSVHDVQLTLCYLPEAYGTVGLPIQVSSGAPTFEQESTWIPRPALTLPEIAADREAEIREYRRRLDERTRELERVREELRALKEARRQERTVPGGR